MTGVQTCALPILLGLQLFTFMLFCLFCFERARQLTARRHRHTEASHAACRFWHARRRPDTTALRRCATGSGAGFHRKRSGLAGPAPLPVAIPVCEGWIDVIYNNKKHNKTKIYMSFIKVKNMLFVYLYLCFILCVILLEFTMFSYFL